MPSHDVLDQLDIAICAAARNDSNAFSTAFDRLDLILQTNGPEGLLRHFFDCWADALNHDFAPYEEQSPAEWQAAGAELRNWYVNGRPLTPRKLWRETLPRGEIPT